MMTDYQGAAINYFNLAGFPAVVEQHYTIGGSYSFTKQIGLDAAYVYSPEVQFSYDTSAMTQAQVYAQTGNAQQAMSMSSTATVKHSQQALSLQLSYKF